MPAKALPTVAIMYDFDKTLCTKDMQEYSFIPSLSMKPKAFWDEANSLAVSQRMDRVLAYMHLMLKKAEYAGISIRRQDFVALGAELEFFPGVEDWFERVNAYGKEAGVNVEHYIISSGLREIIEGSRIFPFFREVYSCEYFYDVNGIARWPKNVVNYTTKTQFLFRINKGVLDISNDEELNSYIPDEQRPVPFENMIYIGDGMTDVPCMKLVKANGGFSAAVYARGGKEKAGRLLRDGRVDLVAPANYYPEKELDKAVKDCLLKIAASSRLREKHLCQREEFCIPKL